MLACCLETSGLWCVRIPEVPVCCWNSANIPARTIPLFVFQCCPPAISFETKFPKLSKMWLPRLNFYTHGSKAALRGWHMPRSLLTLISQRAIHSCRTLSSKDPIYMPSYPCNFGPQQTLHTTWHHLEAISDPPLPSYKTRKDPDLKLWGFTDAVHAGFSISDPFSCLMLTETRRPVDTLWFAKGPY